MDGYVYDSAEEPKILMTGKWNESMSCQPCDKEGEPLPGTELKEVCFFLCQFLGVDKFYGNRIYIMPLFYPLHDSHLPKSHSNLV